MQTAKGTFVHHTFTLGMMKLNQIHYGLYIPITWLIYFLLSELYYLLSNK